MKTEYYVDQGGNYIGGFCGAEPPSWAIEVPTPPNNGTDLWDGSKWVAVPNFEADNAAVLEQLQALDLKSIRALREGNAARIAEIEAEAVALRSKLIR